MADWSSDSDDAWESDGDAEPLSALALSNPDNTLDANGWIHAEAPSSSLVEQYVGKGFPKEMVLKAIKVIGNNDENALCQLLLTYKALGDYPLLGNYSTSGCTPHSIEDEDNLDLDNWDDDDNHAGVREANSDGSIAEDFKQELLQKDKNIKSLVNVGFHEDEANMIITRCGVGVSFFLLVDDSSNFSHHEVTNMSFNSSGGKMKERFKEESKKKRKRCGDREQGSKPPVVSSHDEPVTLPNPMVGFNLPNGIVRSVNRRLPKQAIGPPFFYYENVALAPKGVWGTISKTLYGVRPEFVDSKYLCAAARKRGYIHNLPTKNRAPLHPAPPKTIFEAFPQCNAWWPSWDKRRKLNCLTTCVQGPKMAAQIERVLARADNPPSAMVKKYIMDRCRRYNLVWVGKNKVIHLDADEMEKLLGFPNGHTRGVGIKARYKSLGNSFQVDTVAYHLSVLRDMFPDGIKILSLFTGIGGAEVALHRLGIHMRIVVSVEISKLNRRIFRWWWKETQTGQLIEIKDVQSLTDDIVESLTRKFGGFDLVIGGSPCNNLAGKNRFDRTGLDGKQSSLFYHYSRILDAVKSVMATM
ncbi:DNA (cytosine-5)-methyltransferase DRM2-like [Lolium rigidum]|uniref:DNA (cytosine-5)-methyltransferase DRM2-like n=1 Tax=Lolium rigidum TaxID=89674 RepID=UPI001F5CD2BC|nr:DNA (cytosine-5)-methyltransferase DRM2-like [Lolium rigidum]